MFTLFMTTTLTVWISEFMPVPFWKFCPNHLLRQMVTLHCTGSQWEMVPSDILWSHQQLLAKLNTTGDRNSLGNYY